MITSGDKKTGWFARLKQGLHRTRVNIIGLFTGGSIDEDFLEELEYALISADMGVQTVTELLSKLRETIKLKGLKTQDEVRMTLRDELVNLLKPAEGKIECFLLKDEAKKEVKVYHRPIPGGKSAVTLYKTLKSKGELSLVEAELLTGRTHQIRASFADTGHPLLGDGKYGKGDVNRRYGETRQALYSYYLSFDFTTDAGILEYLHGKAFQVESVPFVEKDFE